MATQFTEGTRVTVRCGSMVKNGTVERVIDGDGACGGVYEVRLDGIGFNRYRDVFLGTDLTLLVPDTDWAWKHKDGLVSMLG
jgi:hypothetical protein